MYECTIHITHTRHQSKSKFYSWENSALFETFCPQVKLSLAIECLKVCVELIVLRIIIRFTKTFIGCTLLQSREHSTWSFKQFQIGFSQLVASRLVAHGITCSNKLRILLCNEKNILTWNDLSSPPSYATSPPPCSQHALGRNCSFPSSFSVSC